VTLPKTGTTSGDMLASLPIPCSSAISLKKLRMKINETISYCFAMDWVVDCGSATISISTS